MKNSYLKLMMASAAAAAAILLASPDSFAQQPSEKTIALRTGSGAYMTMVAGGGLDASGKEIGSKQIFTVVDLNGGEIADGDKVKLRYDSSIWHEDKENKRINRVAIKGSKEDETVFTVKRNGKQLWLQAPSGKFLALEGAAIVTTDKRDNAAPIEFVAAAPPAQPQGYSTAFRLASGKYFGTVSGGGLDASAAQITPKQVFTLVDLNGGQLSSGDAVKIMSEASLWREDPASSVIRRVPARGSKDAETVFKIIVQGKSILLQAPSGKFAAAAPDGRSIVTTDQRDASSLLEAVPQAAAPPAAAAQPPK